MNQDDVLCMPGQQSGAKTPWIHDYCTTTLAVIFGWIEQKYVYVPAFVNVNVNFSSVSRIQLAGVARHAV